MTTLLLGESGESGESLFNEGFSEYNLREVCSGFTNVIVLSLNLLR